tara:strand:- start:944 stop:1132 length:189 start_codon:yes stop_codon:yes gene_type:complete
MKNFRVIESSNKGDLNKRFAIETEITKYITLPFKKEKYRCTMFDGIRVRLVHEEDYIIGTLY